MLQLIPHPKWKRWQFCPKVDGGVVFYVYSVEWRCHKYRGWWELQRYGTPTGHWNATAWGAASALLKSVGAK